MVFSIIKWSILSLTLIFLIHHLYTFLMNTLTVPKIKDLVNKPQEQYKELFQTANGRSGSGSGGGVNFKTIEANDTMKDMTDELSMFLNDLKKTDANAMGSISANANLIGANAMGSIGAMDYNANVIGVNAMGSNVIGANANVIGSNAMGSNVIGANANAMGAMGTMEYNYASL